ncbi:MAG: aminodeoxychorismate synthase component I [Bacteroidales bacterium]|nr:aminodeoxychorismate synthase component I [Bacteroidales bacterium]
MQNKSEISKILSNKVQSGEEFLFAINFNIDELIIVSPKEAESRGIYYDFNGVTNFKYSNIVSQKKFDTFPFDFTEYKIGYDICREALQRGDTYLINYTSKTRVETEYTQQELFDISRAKFKLWVNDRFMIFSPERFVKIEDGKIETRPMKGTINAQIDNAEVKLLSDPKELFEHNTIVDLLRNDLNMVANDVAVEKFRYIDRIKTQNSELLQASSLISGSIKQEYNEDLGELLVRLLPAGSVTGAPKEKTVETIRRAENYNRGFYTGIFGYFDGSVTDIAVAIRFLEFEEDKVYYKSGGGITVNSDPKEEYNEMIHKIYVPLF